MSRYRFRSAISRAAGLGTAKAGFEHWWTQRVTAVALLPLSVWFAASLIAHSGMGYEAFRAWLGSPVTVVLMILLLITLFWHLMLGLQVVVEDYFHSSTKIWALLAIRFLCFALAICGMVAILRIAFDVWENT